jgi:methylated-DNA-[protein]-cysteine S-methyltransferase
MSHSLSAMPLRLCAQTRWTSPLGELLLARTPLGLAGAWFDGQKHHPGPLAALDHPTDPLLQQAISQLEAYFNRAPGSGQHHPQTQTLSPTPQQMQLQPKDVAPDAQQLWRFDLPLDLHGTPFQRAVWQALQGLAPGQTCSYGDIARRVGLPLAVRAVGAAVGRNPVSVIVPCHRVLGRDGSLTGYAGGIERKRALLALEGHR